MPSTDGVIPDWMQGYGDLTQSLLDAPLPAAAPVASPTPVLDNPATMGAASAVGIIPGMEWLPAAVASARALTSKASGAPPAAMSVAGLANIIKTNESGSDYTAYNRQKGMTASGAYQYTDPTWGNYKGYARAAFAPRAVQDERATADITKSLAKYNGDPFKVLASHYLPAVANSPQDWGKRYTFKSGRQSELTPREYVERSIKGTPLEGKFDEYIKQYAS